MPCGALHAEAMVPRAPQFAAAGKHEHRQNEGDHRHSFFVSLFFLLFDLLLFSPRDTSLGKKPHYHSRFLSVSFENTCATLPEKPKLTASPVLNFSVVSVMGTMMITSLPSAVMCR